MTAPIGRLAPSPTGLLHVGHASSFLLAWLSIRSRGGSLRLRMEDLDTSRVRPGMADASLEDIAWLGLDWDGPVEFQSDHTQTLHAAALDLHARGLAYPCVCTRKEIEQARSAPHAADATSLYPGTCRDRFESIEEARAASGREPALRLRVTDDAVTIHDELHGDLTQTLARDVGDFPITSRDGQVAYQLAVVVDDARQGISEVLRGDDLLDSTPRQAYLQTLLGLPAPRWIHVPLIHDESGERLAKRHDALSLRALREAGVSAESLVAWLGRSLGLSSGRTARPADLLDCFSLQRLPREPLVFESTLLRSLKEPN